MSLLALIKGRRGATGFGFASSAEDVCAGLDLSGKNILITGVNSGLGQESARVLAARGAHIIGLARTKDKAQQALADLGIPGDAVACELSEPASVRQAIADVKALGKPLHVVMGNAGIMALPELHQSHGYELQFFTNHMGHFILVNGLLDNLTPDGRVVILSSAAHTFPPKEGIQFDNLSGEVGYTGFRAYGQSKLANVLFVRELAKRLTDGQAVYAVHPGGIATNLGRHMEGGLAGIIFPLVGWIGMKNVGQGAATQCYVAAHPDAAGVSGEYWADCNIKETSDHGKDAALAAKLWQVSEEIAAKI